MLLEGLMCARAIANKKRNEGRERNSSFDLSQVFQQGANICLNEESGGEKKYHILLVFNISTCPQIVVHLTSQAP